jgi:predicted amidophosphoribosyltransferase
MPPVAAIPNRVLDLAFPARCPGCGREGPAICAGCAPALDARLELPGGISIGLPSDVPAPLLQLEWCAPFSGLVRRALHELKYGGETRLAVPLGDAIAQRWRRVAAGGDVLVPVPVHAERARRRGYDQAELIARAAGRGLGLPCAPLLERVRATIAQFDLDRATRATNVRGAFRLRPGPATGARGARAPLIDPAGARAAPGPPVNIRAATAITSAPKVSPLAGRWVILIDDVVTTGATLSACAEPLLAAGAIGVSAITVARER